MLPESQHVTKGPAVYSCVSLPADLRPIQYALLNLSPNIYFYLSLNSWYFVFKSLCDFLFWRHSRGCNFLKGFSMELKLLWALMRVLWQAASHCASAAWLDRTAKAAARLIWHHTMKDSSHPACTLFSLTLHVRNIAEHQISHQPSHWHSLIFFSTGWTADAPTCSDHFL